MKTKQTVVLFGAGKTGRGFLAHLLFRAGFFVIFVEKNEELQQSMRSNQTYSIHFKDQPEKTEWISAYEIFHPESQRQQVIEAVISAAFIMTAVGGQHLSELVELLGEAIESTNSSRQWYIITAENWHQPAQEFKQALLKAHRSRSPQRLEKRLHCADATVLRTVVDFAHKDDALAVMAQDYWILQIDGDEIKEKDLPEIAFFEFVQGFQGSLQRKIFTYNAASAAVCYLGYRLQSDDYGASARHPVIAAVIRKVFSEVEAPLCDKFGYTRQEQYDYAAKALVKFQDSGIYDTNFRNAEDPVRKLGRNDRITGPGLMVLEYGLQQPVALAFVAAAALRFIMPQDPVSLQLQEARRRNADSHILADIAGVTKGHPWAVMVEQAGKCLDTGSNLEDSWRLWLERHGK